MPAAVSATKMFDQDTAVTVQLFQEFAQVCWQSEFTTADRNEPTLFKVKTP